MQFKTTARYDFRPTRMAIIYKNGKITSVIRENVGKVEPSYTDGGEEKSCSPSGKQSSGSSKSYT